MELDSTAPPPAASAERPSWIERNWKWLIPVGALALLVAIACFVAAIFAIVMASVRGSEPYAEGLARARANQAVVAALGEPIEPGWWFKGSISVNGPSGMADLATPLHGPSGSGMLYLTAKKQADVWTYDLLEVSIDGSAERIKLLDAPASARE